MNDTTPNDQTQAPPDEHAVVMTTIQQGQGRTEADALSAVVTQLAKPTILDGKKAGTAVVVPMGKRIESMIHLRAEEEAWLVRRTRGSATLTRLSSFLDHVDRFAEAQTAAIFATDAKLTAVYDYHQNSVADHCDHRAEYTFPKSKAWQAWTRVFNKPLGAMDLSTLLEDRIEDVMDPSSSHVGEGARDLAALLGLRMGTVSELVTVAREMRVSVKKDVASAHVIATGELELQYSESHETKTKGGLQVLVPTGFFLALPVHEAGPVYSIVVRLRYMLDGAKVVWTLVPARLEEVERHAVETIVDLVDAHLAERASRDNEPPIPLFWGERER